MKNLWQRLPFLGNLEPEQTYFFHSAAEFSVHELIEQLVKNTGRSQLKIASFSIGETTLRVLHRMCEDGLISHLSCLLDISVKRHKLGLLFFASNVGIEISMSKNHAKLVLIQSDSLLITILTSANLQVNDKNEVGVISTQRSYFDYYSVVFDQWFSSGLKVSANDFE